MRQGGVIKKLVFAGFILCCVALLAGCGKEERPAPGKKPMADRQQKDGPKQQNAPLNKIKKQVARTKDKIKQVKPGKQAKLLKYVEGLEKHLDAAEAEGAARFDPQKVRE
ncbi:MAG: hypothetical protein QME75_03550 [Deltaproteobacteria bacterium]|nr:hypothetical protein [Deltaproteobacteria bacterium]